MYISELGARIRKARKARGLTQAEVARRAGITRETLNQLEVGMAKDLGIAKILRVLRTLDLDLLVADKAGGPETDYVRLAAVAGSTGFREPLSEEEVIRALSSGKPPARKKPHLRRLLEDSPPGLVNGLLTQLAQWGTATKLNEGIASLAKALDVDVRREWTTTD